MRALAVVGLSCLVAVPVWAAPGIVAVAPPSGDSPSLAEAGLLMQAEAASWLQSTHHRELHAKQILRALESHRIALADLDQPALAARARSVLGAPLLVFGRLSAGKSGWLLSVGGLGESGPLPSAQLALPAALPQAIAAGARALESAVASAEGLDPPPLPTTTPLGSSSERALSSYGSCYATLIRQPISIDGPTVLSAAELGRAVQSCRAATAADANFEAAWAALGLGLALSGEDAEAVRALLRVHADRSYLPMYWIARYWLVTRYQSPDAGVTALRQALKQHPGFLLARGYLADHLMVTGHTLEALDAWRDYSVDLPRSAFLRGRVSAALARLGRTDEAIAAAKEALAIDPRDRDAVLELGSRYLDAKKLDLAIATMEAAADGNSRGELLLRLGWAYFDKGDLTRAEALFRRAEEVATQPSEWRTRARARADLARVCDSRGDSAGAQQSMRRALDEGAGPYLHSQRDRRLVELVTAVESTPRPVGKVSGPRLMRPVELSPFPLDPAGDIDLRARQFPTPPPQFELLRF